MGTRKRSRSEAHTQNEQQQEEEEPGLLQTIRNCWEFASLMQYISIFGKVMKIDEDFEIEDLEEECLKPEPSHKLLEIGLCLLKWISSHRGLTFDNFDEYARRQYNAKGPQHNNPFGYEEEPNKFLHMEVFTKLRVLHQLSVWTFWNADRLREKMPESKENEQTEWRIEEFGWDREGRSYYVLDDNRLYRRTDPAIPEPVRPQKKAKSRSSRASRASKRASAVAVEEESAIENHNGETGSDELKWECVAVTLQQYHDFLETIKSKDEDEKLLYTRIEDHVLPLLLKIEDAQQRKRQKREKELHSMQLLAGAKRSSRLAAKEERERSEKEAADAARKREIAMAEARRDQARHKQLEQDRQSRMMTREQRIKDREQKRILHEAELEHLAAEQEKLERGESRASARNLQAELAKSQKTLEQLKQEDQWVFDCSGCGAFGENMDDGSHSVACEKCNVWQHSSCLNIKKEDAGKDDFHFICRDCKQKQEDYNQPKLPPIKFRVSASPSSPSDGNKRKVDEDDDLPPSSPVKKTRTALSDLQNGPSTGLPAHQTLPSLQGQFYIPQSPERRAQFTNQTPLPSSSPPRPLFSPQKNGTVQHTLPPMQPGPLPPIGTFGSFPSVRPSSSHSGHGPIQNQPSMSPTQGNRDVGPLAGFPPVAINGSNSFQSYSTPRPQSGHGALPAMSGNYRRFSAAATPNGSHSSPPHSSHGIGMSGISPTKQSPRPMTAGMAGAHVLPLIHRLEPSPKLMGRNSPDAPIPPPVKCMTPEQEERRAREMQQGYSYSQQMSSPTMNRIPSLNSTAQQPEPVPSPQRGDKTRQ
ncbi:hypothetical protein N7495_003840 [Penicillium taxi]|uniref:uncharacterized protein n=1 Tax=Penicillium taxi TaxID=168475 RepID=UPI002544F926|nr:uncharacterized protein N7495_003840 [Penicillium taxi]KAJ5899096.1 hypothetical protein N7495_003840 [Penicillium taxi]